MPLPGGGQTHLLLVVNVVVTFLLAAFSFIVAVALTRRGERQRIEAERLAATGRATARILHQLKNPLQNLLLHTEVLADERVAGDGAARVEATAAILGEGARVTELMAELTAFASGVQRRLQLAPLPLHQLVKAVLQSERLEVERGGADLVAESLEELDIQGDLYFLRQAIENIVRNARDAFSDGVSGDKGCIALRLRRRGNEAILEIQDNGPGIDPTRLATIFEPFVSSKHRGMGLGLPICREIVEGHGGRIDVRSHTGVGTVMILHLPLDRGDGGTTETREPR